MSPDTVEQAAAAAAALHGPGHSRAQDAAKAHPAPCSSVQGGGLVACVQSTGDWLLQSSCSVSCVWQHGCQRSLHLQPPSMALVDGLRFRTTLGSRRASATRKLQGSACTDFTLSALKAQHAGSSIWQ